MTQAPQNRPYLKWTIIVISLAAISMSLWLTIQKWTGEINHLAGCGAGSGCANVLGSKWSMVWGIIPVSAFSLLLYLSVLLTIGIRRRSLVYFHRCVAWLCLWAAIWFTGLQIFILKTICPYCMTMHFFGVALGISLLYFHKNDVRKNRTSKKTTFFLQWWVWLPAIMVTALACIQHWGPEPPSFREDHIVIHRNESNKNQDIHALGKGKTVTFLKGEKLYNIESLPHLGPTNADIVIVEYFDYTCEACKEMHELLNQVVKRQNGQLAVIVLPIPFNSQCNPNLPKGAQDHPNACKLAKLALYAWRVAPDKFPEIHQSMFNLQGAPYEVIEAMVEGSLPDQSQNKNEKINREWANKILKQNVADYQWLVKKTPVMPKLMLSDSVIIQGLVPDANQLLDLINQHHKKQVYSK